MLQHPSMAVDVHDVELVPFPAVIGIDADANAGSE